MMSFQAHDIEVHDYEADEEMMESFFSSQNKDKEEEEEPKDFVDRYTQQMSYWNEDNHPGRGKRRDTPEEREGSRQVGETDKLASDIQKAMNKHKKDDAKMYQLQQARKAMNKGDLEKAKKIVARYLEEGVSKTKKALDQVITLMKDLAKKYKEGDKSVVDQLKTLTITKKKLEVMLDKEVAGTSRDQELDKDE